jgi:hypothetical protein
MLNVTEDIVFTPKRAKELARLLSDVNTSIQNARIASIDALKAHALLRTKLHEHRISFADECDQFHGREQDRREMYTQILAYQQLAKGRSEHLQTLMGQKSQIHLDMQLLKGALKKEAESIDSSLTRFEDEEAKTMRTLIIRSRYKNEQAWKNRWSTARLLARIMSGIAERGSEVWNCDNCELPSIIYKHLDPLLWKNRTICHAH